MGVRFEIVPFSERFPTVAHPGLLPFFLFFFHPSLSKARQIIRPGKKKIEGTQRPRLAAVVVGNFEV